MSAGRSSACCGGYSTNRLLTAYFGALLLLPLPSFAASAPVASDATACTEASAAIERAAHVPPQLLHAIGIVETGRVDPVRHLVAPWPWSVDVNGTGYFYATKQEAVVATAGFRAAGHASIDVGCMQINLQNHPTAFASLEEAFDPGANTAYAASFLQVLYRQTGSWPAAAAAYHSQTPGIAEPYRDRVMAAWPLAGHYGAVPGLAAGAPISVDPYHVLTPAFRARLAEDAAFRSARNAAMLGRPAPSLKTAWSHAVPHAGSHELGWHDAER